jgi:hypothetical protein
MHIPYLKDLTKTLWLSSIPQHPLPSNNKHPQTSLSLANAEIPDGPFSFCDVSRSTDLFAISSISITKQPVYMYIIPLACFLTLPKASLSYRILILHLSHRDDLIFIHLYGTFLNTFTGNGTLNVKVDCGSHCSVYGLPPDWPGESTDEFTFCEMSRIEQPLDGMPPRNETCPPVKGAALITSVAYVPPMFIRPVSTPDTGVRYRGEYSRSPSAFPYLGLDEKGADNSGVV